MKSDHSPECHKCAARMTDADIEAEAPMQDGLCIGCRKSREAAIEEEAVASFCEDLADDKVEWFSNVIAAAGFKYERRVPSAVERKATNLRYTSNRLHMDLFWANSFITIYTYPHTWAVQFSSLTPVPVILAAIKTAVEHKAK